MFNIRGSLAQNNLRYCFLKSRFYTPLHLKTGITFNLMGSIRDRAALELP